MMWTEHGKVYRHGSVLTTLGRGFDFTLGSYILRISLVKILSTTELEEEPSIEPPSPLPSEKAGITGWSCRGCGVFFDSPPTSVCSSQRRHDLVPAVVLPVDASVCR